MFVEKLRWWVLVCWYWLVLTGNDGSWKNKVAVPDKFCDPVWMIIKRKHVDLWEPNLYGHLKIAHLFSTPEANCFLKRRQGKVGKTQFKFGYEYLYNRCIE